MGLKLKTQAIHYMHSGFRDSLLAANIPPVAAPEIIEFHGSSFLRIYTSEQSIVEKSPPHTAN